VIRTGGGHHFDGDYAPLARHIDDGVLRRASAALGL
jgi:type IV secretory pathway VirJ component